jgi:ABC-type lipoprotein release transport system permease subunit
MKVFENLMIAGGATLGGMLLGFVYLLAGAPGIKSYFLGWAVIYPDMEIPIHISASTVATIVAVGIFPLLVATVIPTWTAGIIDPDEAMRG